ncbi:MAG: transketolase [Candidatus Omnitrophica bacterium]|nr:transketolase [Candidatus Omnitrophota bacterium]
MRNAYLAALYELAKKDKRILALVADNGAIVYDKYRRDFPDRFINFGIAEANMVTIAAGLAACGKIPFAYTISSFLTMRAFEQIRNDLCLQKANVKLVGIGAGFVYSNLGPTHHSVEDIAIMRVLPEMTIFSPADPLEAQKVTIAAAEIKGPVYIRISVGGTPSVYTNDYLFKAGEAVVLRPGKDLTIFSTGGIILEVLKASEELEGQGISVRVVNMHTIKPLDKKCVLVAASQTGAILTVEEHSIYGGLGSAVAEVLAEENVIPVPFRRMRLKGVFPSGYGTYEEMKEINGLAKADIVKNANSLLKNKGRTNG